MEKEAGYIAETEYKLDTTTIGDGDIDTLSIETRTHIMKRLREELKRDIKNTRTRGKA
jgi:hypothetical protein